jgi:hypothetical protein
MEPLIMLTEPQTRAVVVSMDNSLLAFIHHRHEPDFKWEEERQLRDDLAERMGDPTFEDLYGDAYL